MERMRHTIRFVVRKTLKSSSEQKIKTQAKFIDILKSIEQNAYNFHHHLFDSFKVNGGGGEGGTQGTRECQTWKYTYCTIA